MAGWIFMDSGSQNVDWENSILNQVCALQSMLYFATRDWFVKVAFHIFTSTHFWYKICSICVLYACIGEKIIMIYMNAGMACNTVMGYMWWLLCYLHLIFRNMQLLFQHYVIERWYHILLRNVRERTCARQQTAYVLMPF